MAAERGTERKARMLLRRLSVGGRLQADETGATWRCIAGSRETGADAAAVKHLLRAGFIEERAKDVLVLSPAGRRELAERDGASDAYRRQHQHLGTKLVEGERVAVDLAESPIAWLRTRKDRDGKPMITEEQYLAGLKLQADHTRGHLSPRITTNWDVSRAHLPASGRSGGLSLGEQALAARQRYHCALDAVGPELSRILVEVCCRAVGIEAAERSLGWPRRSGKVVLQLALTRLARVYGFVRDAGEARRKDVRSWGAAGYRPSIPSGPD
jgi:hypothetical protein